MKAMRGEFQRRNWSGGQKEDSCRLGAISTGSVFECVWRDIGGTLRERNEPDRRWLLCLKEGAVDNQERGLGRCLKRVGS